MVIGDDYLGYFGLRETPFALTPDPAFLFLTDSHQRAMEGLETFVARGEGFAVLLGDIGTGKTTICRALMERMTADVETALLINPFLDETELIHAIASDLGLELDADAPDGAAGHQLMDRLAAFLAETHAQGKRCVVILDEAHNLPIPALEQARILGNLETNKEKLLQIVLVGQLEMDSILSSPRMRQLKQRIARWHRLEPLSEEDVEAYFRFRLQCAGLRRDLKLEPEARRLAHRLTRGYPRVMNILFDRALVRVARRGAWVVEEQDVREAGRELPDQGEPPPVATRTEETPPDRPRASGLVKALFALLLIAVLVGAGAGAFLLAGKWPWSPGGGARRLTKRERWTVSVGAFATRSQAIDALNHLPADVKGKKFVAPLPASSGGRYLACVGDFRGRQGVEDLLGALERRKVAATLRDTKDWKFPGEPE